MKELIISIGNIAMGGTGKTPFTIFLAKHFVKNGHRVAILSLGYKGKLGYKTTVISDGEAIYYKPPMAADEPYMMAKQLLSDKVVVITGKERNASYEVASKQYACNIILLDDGFQHQRMRRDVDIVLLDHKKPLSTGFPFPFGYLREFPSALKRADILVFTRAKTTEIPEKVKLYSDGKKIYFCEHVYDGFSFADGKIEDNNFIIGKNIWLMSGIAGSKQFENQIKEMGGNVLGHTKFGDHHTYTEKEIKDVLQADADLFITTEKDMVKLPENSCLCFCYPRLALNMMNSGLEEYLDSKLVQE